VSYNDPMGDVYDAFAVMDGGYIASGRGESVYRDMDPYGRNMSARIMAESIERQTWMKAAQDSEITVDDGIYTFIFGPNGVVNFSYTSDAEFSALSVGRKLDDLRAMFSGAPIMSSYKGGPRLWQAEDGGFVQLREGAAYIPGTNQRYYGSSPQILSKCQYCWLADLLRNVPAPNNPFYQAEAIVFDGGWGFVGAEGDKGMAFILVGKDKGRFVKYKEIAGGGGTDGGFAGEIGVVDTDGNPDNFTAEYLFGARDKVYLTVGNGVSVGFGLAKSDYNGIGVYTKTIQIGIGFSAWLISGGYNHGDIDKR